MESWIFLHLGKQSLTMVGPMVLDQVKLELAAHRLSLDDLVYLPGQGSSWKRIYSVEKFSPLLMALPNDRELSGFESKAKAALPANDEATVIQGKSELTPAESTKAPAKAPTIKSVALDSGDRATWFLQFEGSEFGPFTVPELGKILDSGKLKGNLFAWKRGLKNWIPVSNLSQLQQEISSSTSQRPGPVIEKGANARSHPRISLIATVSFTLNKTAQIIGVCSDVSEGGMQVLNSDALELKKGGKIELMINPIGVTGIEPFSVLAQIAWTSKDPHKIGFQFINGASNLGLQNYIRRATSLFKD